jgi:hypothetical protein
VPTDSSALHLVQVSARRSLSLFAGMPSCIAAGRRSTEHAQIDLDERTRAELAAGGDPGAGWIDESVSRTMSQTQQF